MRSRGAHRDRLVGWLIACLLVLAVAGAQTAAAADQAQAPQVGGVDAVAHPAGLPSIGKWMINSMDKPANWLGAPYHSKEIWEPINVVIVDEAASSVEEAKRRLLNAAAEAGFPRRYGHSDGYSCLIGGTRYAQVAAADWHAFSDGIFLLPNDHGRIFGPARADGRYVFTGAFSREGIAPFARIKHSYISFDVARDRFATAMDQETTYHIVAYVNLDNVILGDSQLTTGDHDGLAVVLRTTE